MNPDQCCWGKNITGFVFKFKLLGNSFLSYGLNYIYYNGLVSKARSALSLFLSLALFLADKIIKMQMPTKLQAIYNLNITS